MLFFAQLHDVARHGPCVFYEKEARRDDERAVVNLLGYLVHDRRQ
jgi:hypothetical protein